MNTILFLAANPSGTERLALDQEARDIEEGIRFSNHNQILNIKTVWATRPRDIRRAMQDHKPRIVHFSGHGTGSAGILVETPEGGYAPISAEALGGLFELFSDCVECVVLNACYSDQQIRPIARHIRYVVGMQNVVNDRAAIEFAVALYDAVAAGRDFNWAFKSAKNAVALAGLESAFEPVLVAAAPLNSEASMEIPLALHDLFVMWTISGLLRTDAEDHAYLLAAFRNLILAAGHIDPVCEMRIWLEDAKRRASEACGLPKSAFAHQDFEVDIAVDSLEVEESFFRLWKSAISEREPSNMAKVRVALIAYVGQEYQKELIKDWNTRL